MSQISTIEWTDASWTALRARVKVNAGEIAESNGYGSLVQVATKMQGHIGPHCEHVSPGCENCYSETNSGRCLPSNGTGLPFDRRARDLVDLFVDEKILMQPLHWKKGRRIFVCSQTDLFAEFYTDEMIDRVFAVMALCPQHVFQVLTKRAKRMREYFADLGRVGEEVAGYVYDLLPKPLKPGVQPIPRFPLPNVHLGVSVEDQQRADERIPDLLRTPAVVRFLSCEPLLELVDISRFLRHNLVHEETARRNCLQGSIDRGNGDRFRRANLESEAARVGSMEASGGGQGLQKSESGERLRGLPNSGRNVRQEALRYGRAPLSMPTLQGSDTGRVDDKSQGRDEEAESPGQSGISDLLRAANPCNARPAGGAWVQPARTEELNGSLYGQPDIGDPSDLCTGRSHPGAGGGAVRDGVSDDIQDCARRQAPSSGWTSGGLCAPAEQSAKREKQQGSISLAIIGGESGPGSRPCNTEWVRSIVAQCKAAEVPVFVKQLGAHVIQGGVRRKKADKKGADMSEWPADLRVREMPVIGGRV